jgi:hypothetical protein
MCAAGGRHAAPSADGASSTRQARHKFNKRVLQMSAFGRTVLALVVALTSLGAISQKTRDPGVTDKEIRIGNVMPYTGALSAFGAIGRTEAAYFEMSAAESMAARSASFRTTTIPILPPRST